ncbi:MAG TPA: bis(5'-nucleosyl)-tetraphosphatase (symmetrical) YqeK [Treponemataceae bacterium]|nr:bis(5'-nucleosyl)-tetraphosphatase (symmetrical) YqeK [Treponemataceae bacterium]
MKQKIEKLRQYAIEYQSSKMYKHSIRVAKLSKKLAKMYGADPQKAYYAGLAHDLCKEMDADTIYKFAQTDGLPMEEIEKKKLKLLHGRAAAVLVQSFFHVDDAEIIEAIRYHTFGKAHMSTLAKIVYVADKIEPKRKQVNKAYYRNLFELKLDDMVRCVVQENMEYLKNKKKEVSFLTENFLSSLNVDKKTACKKVNTDEQS